jgi:uncharacterized protein
LLHTSRTFAFTFVHQNKSMEILGYALALVIGLTLGVIGGGGSILTVPVLVYVLGIDAVTGTAYSLFIVGATALVGGIQNYLKGLVNLKTAVVFAIPSFIAVYLTRRYLVPSIPEHIMTVGDFIVTRDIAIMAFFALIMLLAAISMIRSGAKKIDEELQVQKFNYPLIVVEGAVVGVLTGVVGAGGGFLIIPALVLLARLPIKMAIGTSLLIIAAKSLIGFTGDLAAGVDINWVFLLIFTALSIVGIFIGVYLTKFIPAGKLKTGFGYFVLIMAVYILAKEFGVFG